MVLSRLLKRVAEPVNPPAAVPDGVRVYAIGDIHGRLDLLDRLLALIGADDSARGQARTELISLGDLVDRGPHSAQVVDRLLSLKRSGGRIRFLMGNHEEVFLKALSGDVQALRFFIRIGGQSTILSYGITPDLYDALDYEELSQALIERVPREHVDFLQGFEDHVRVGDYLFVHAGIRPRLTIEEQKGSDLRWIRGDFLDYRGSHGCIVVHGHTISDEVEERTNRIGIDTGAYASDRLTAIGLEGAERWFLST